MIIILLAAQVKIFLKRLLVSSYLSIGPSVRVEQLDPTEWIIVKFVI